MSELEIWQKVEEAYQILSNCSLCPRECGVNRLQGEKGYCGMSAQLYISSFGPHFGEEPELVGRFGSGTIFLTGCSLRCAFCQNYEISHLNRGYRLKVEELSEVMLALEAQGCENINFVTPTHYVPQLMEAIIFSKKKGLSLPIVYNSGGYEKLETLRLLEGFVDIYMPDAKFSLSDLAERYCQAADYPQLMQKAIKEMHRQVGNLDVSEAGIAKRGLLVRHLVMPGSLKNSELIFKFLAEEISRDTYLNIMAQYYPSYQAFHFKEIARRVSREEYLQAISLAKNYGLWRGFH